MEIFVKEIMMSTNLLGIRIKELADLSGKSLNKIEKELGYPRNTLRNYNRVNNPSVERVFELAAYFGVSPEYLVEKSLGKMIYSTRRLFEHLNETQKEEMYELMKDWAKKRKIH